MKKLWIINPYRPKENVIRGYDKIDFSTITNDEKLEFQASHFCFYI